MRAVEYDPVTGLWVIAIGDVVRVLDQADMDAAGEVVERAVALGRPVTCDEVREAQTQNSAPPQP